MTPNDSTNHDLKGSDASLCAADQRAVDLLIEHGFDLAAATKANPADRERLAAAHAFFMRVEAYPVQAPDSALIDATLARIDRATESTAQRMRIGSGAAPSLGRGRWADFIAVACVAVLLISVGLPVLNEMRHRREVEFCASNMRTIGSALTAYHGDFNSRPIAAGLAPDLSKLTSWSNYDNSKHLDVLHQKGYCLPECLCCANDAQRDGYASQVPNERLNRMWAMQSHLPLLADRNPLVMLTALGHPIGATVENSLDHGGRGQNVLFSDLAVMFEISPLITIQLGDIGGPTPENIWIPADRGGIEAGVTNGLSSPAQWSEFDVFLLQ